MSPTQGATDAALVVPKMKTVASVSDLSQGATTAMGHPCSSAVGSRSAEIARTSPASTRSGSSARAGSPARETRAAGAVPLGTPVVRSLYDELTGSADRPILFAWIPKPLGWTRGELAERTTRCLPAVRPGIDLVALPRLREVQELWDCWATEHAMASWQVIWFEPRLGKASAADGALDEILRSLPRIPEPTDPLCFYPMYLTPQAEEAGRRSGVRVVGDRAEHKLGPLPCAKAWLHPHIDPQRRGSNLRDTLQQAGAKACSARGPIGYIASSSADLKAALRALRQETPQGTRFVLKPSWASGGEGILLDVCEEQLEDFDFPDREECTAILEELIESDETLGDTRSPTLYMIGDRPCGAPADQLLRDGGAVNLGNRWPSQLPADLAQACTEVAKEVHKSWGLQSQWGLDFVLDRSGTPIIVDLNMGRPNGNFAVRMWESRGPNRLNLHTSSWRVPEGLPAPELFRRVRLAGLAWNPETARGVIIYQHLPGLESAYVVASAAGWEEVDEFVSRLEALFAELAH